MTPPRWQGAGVILLAIAALLVVAAFVSVLNAATPVPVPVRFEQYQPNTLNLFGASAVLRGVVLGAFAGVAFFLGLACFAWSALVEARTQRAEILNQLKALNARQASANQTSPSPTVSDTEQGTT